MTNSHVEGGIGTRQIRRAPIWRFAVSPGTRATRGSSSRPARGSRSGLFRGGCTRTASTSIHVGSSNPDRRQCRTGMRLPVPALDPTRRVPGRTRRCVGEPASTTQGRTLPSRPDCSASAASNGTQASTTPVAHGSSRSNSSSSSGVRTARRCPSVGDGRRGRSRPGRRTAGRTPRPAPSSWPSGPAPRPGRPPRPSGGAPPRRVASSPVGPHAAPRTRPTGRPAGSGVRGRRPLEGAPAGEPEPLLGVEEREAQVGRRHVAVGHRGQHHGDGHVVEVVGHACRRPRGAGRGWGRRRGPPGPRSPRPGTARSRRRRHRARATRYWARSSTDRGSRCLRRAASALAVGLEIGNRGSETTWRDSLNERASIRARRGQQHRLSGAVGDGAFHAAGPPGSGPPRTGRHHGRSSSHLRGPRRPAPVGPGPPPAPAGRPRRPSVRRT